jgi:sulfur carrier protein
VNVLLNGELRELPGSATVVQAVEAAGVEQEGRGLAVAVDGDVVPRAQWEETRLADGQRVEVLRAVQGGA